MAVDPVLVRQIGVEALFPPDIVEQVLILKALLRMIIEDPKLSDHLVLIGGTAINLFDENLPRLSVDLDIDYTQGKASFDTSLIESDIDILTRIAASLETESFEKRRPIERGVEKLRLIFECPSNFGRETCQVKFDISYLQKTMIYDPVQIPMPPLSKADPYQGFKFALADPCELWAGKAVAVIYKSANDPKSSDVSDLYSTQLARHLFDVSRIEELIQKKSFSFDADRLRKAFILKAVPRVKDLQLLSADGLRHCHDHEVRTALDPYLRQLEKPQRPALDKMKELTKEFMYRICSNAWNPEEKEFVRLFQKSGEYVPQLLFGSDSAEYRRLSGNQYLKRCADAYRTNV